jgi:Flp pilus assembly pilin Flp
MQSKGQNITEIAIILALIAILAVSILTLLGDNIKTIFSKSNTRVESYKPFEFGPPNTNPSTNNPEDTGLTTEGKPVLNSDNSVNFTVEGQDFTIPASTMAQLNEVFDTAGSAGVNEEILAAMKRLIQAHKDEFAPDKVEIDMIFGQGERGTTDMSVFGDASLNLAVLAVGDHMILIQKDKLATSAGFEIEDSAKAIHTIEGYREGTAFSGSIIDGDDSTQDKIYNTTIAGNYPQLNFNEAVVRSPGETGLPNPLSLMWRFDFTTDKTSI